MGAPRSRVAFVCVVAFVAWNVVGADEERGMESFVEFTDDRKCTGMDQESGPCEDLEECAPCEPVNCEWRAWSDWYEMGGCSGLVTRSRSIDHHNNECGKPCQGPKTDSKKVPSSERCAGKKSVCTFSSWSKWSTCTSHLDQKFRSRSIVKDGSAVRQGSECDGALNETGTCGSDLAVPCGLSPWGAWTPCSAPCGAGHKTKFRKVLTRAAFGGRPCAGELQITEACFEKPCSEDRDCEFGSWEEWSHCEPGSRQRFRSREVKAHKIGVGKACEGSMEETLFCESSAQESPTCDVTAWGAWSVCDKQCDGGQTYRTRILRSSEGGSGCANMSVHEVAACNTAPCHDNADCKLSEWADWGACSVDCGQGTSERHRKIISFAAHHGDGCNDTLREVKGCNFGECHTRDCKWGEWDRWSACSASCDGGTRIRERHVKVSPLGSGALCEPKDKEEVEPCNTHSCGSCIDGSFLEWTEWTPCSATCDDGFRSRHREIGTHPNHCGKPIGGLTDEFEQCSADKPCIEAHDCKLSAWSAWGDCSGSCIGVKERSRVIESYATGTGKPCQDVSLKDISRCAGDSPKCGPPKAEACRLSEWSEWEPCSARCNGGQRSRTRSILTPAQLGGEPCTASLIETYPCNTKKICDDTLPVDCMWGDWKEWGACTRCGDQRYRHRSILQLPNKFGKLCEMGDTKQVGSCDSECNHDIRYCSWSEWSSYGQCSAECGPSIKTRTRSLSPTSNSKSALFKGGPDLVCGGSQMDIVKCPSRDCTAHCEPKNAKFLAWSQWSASSCTQLCERFRVVEESASCGGLQAHGPLVGTKRCPHKCAHSEDCELSEWQDWSECKGSESQRIRTRAVLNMPANGGKPCEGGLEETKSCNENAPKPVQCEMAEWNDWSECSVTCGSGFHKRQRDLKGSASHGGSGCEGPMEEVETCKAKVDDCVKDTECVLGEWEDWSACDGSQQFSKRRVRQEAKGNGAPCNASMKIMKSCTHTKDCEVTEWTGWDRCDKHCGGGQQQRQRQITAHPSVDGLPCPRVLMETRGCNSEPCEDDGVVSCELGAWTAWSPCSATCGTAQKTRSRFMESTAGCNESLVEVADCEGIPACVYKPCLWLDWSEWSSCTCECGGGQRSRDRHIKFSPERGGAPCDLSDKEEIAPCNTHPCSRGPCIDGEWGEWRRWEVCSSTCKGGMTWRSRPILREANSCGKPVNGSAFEYASCNSDIECAKSKDCELAEWSDWSGCTAKCGGVKRRSRTIAQHKRGKGTSCEGDLKQTAPCQSAEDAKACLKKESPAQDCIIGEWEKWGTCSAECGGGQRSRVRSIERAPAGGGKPCDGPLEVVAPCNTGECKNACVKQDCAWGHWMDWGSCSKCGGQQKRYRHIKHHAKCGGAACVPGAAEETIACGRNCHAVSYCGWTEWSEWGSCDKTCGKGTRMRNRRLTVKSEERFLDDDVSKMQVTKLHDAAIDLQQLRRETEHLEARHAQELVAAFAGGGLTIFLAMAVLKARSLRHSLPGAGASALAQGVD